MTWGSKGKGRGRSRGRGLGAGEVVGYRRSLRGGVGERFGGRGGSGGGELGCLPKGSLEAFCDKRGRGKEETDSD